MKSRLLPLFMAACLTGAGGFSAADDGAITNKSMSRTIKVPEFTQEVVSGHLPEAEHAFTDMMRFYVPMQAASGAVGDLIPDPDDPESKDPRDYYNIGGEWVETLDVAKPLVNVFIYGPAIGVEGTPFAHSFMDTYGAVSLDDGATWKQTNLSQSADLSSFDRIEDHVPGTGGGHHLPADHTELLSHDGIEAWHAPNYDYPYTYGCTDCHGETLEGGKGESCYSCHGSVWDEADPADIGPTITEADWSDSAGGRLKAKGDSAPAETALDVINAETKEVLASTVTNRRGKWTIVARRLGTAPCTIAAVANGVEGPALVPEDTPEECEGKPGFELAEYPGGTYNVFHATAGNKVLVAWPSRFCQQGQPAYSFAWDGDDSDIIANDPLKAEELIAKRIAVAKLIGIEVTEEEGESRGEIPNDLYLTDLFEVAGSQGSIDFADEGYPQAGVVPFGCVWTARGVLLPGDDPRTEAAEETHMVWTKAERLTSGRRDPNRIEVAGVAGAGFVITWQEDPDGLRPGQGEGPGEGWSGAVAHDKTDIWYSFIPWEHFDWVENPDDPAGAPVNIVDHVLGNPDPDDPDNDADGGRPQVYVPMAVPMRMTNNDKCNAEEYGPSVSTPSEKKWFSYCNYSDVDHGDVAAAYGLQDFCADTVMVPQGRPDPITGVAEEGPICVNAEGLPNIANTASTRPRLSLQGYDSDRDGATDSAWVVVAAEESKGLGRYAFDFVDDPLNGTPCEPDEGQPEEGEDTNPDCEADIGKNQWYFSFDMGDPDTSATKDEPNGLVQNLVSQGNLLNQPEVNWRTGEFFPTINTSRMWDFSGSENGKDYNYALYNTEIARRSSLLVQSIKSAVNSQSGLVAIPSWKQGAMRQGGPADTMLRLIRLPEGYAGAECPLNDTVDPQGPLVDKAEYVVNNNGSVAFRLTVSGLDGDPDTGIQIRNAVTGEDFGARRFIDDGVTTVTYGINLANWPEVPCAVQAAEGASKVDSDTLAYGDWIVVTDRATGLPHEGCFGELPEGCETGTTVAAEDASSLPGIEVNPYAFTNMDCTHPDGDSGWILQEAGSNPYYPDGICAAPATNLSSVVPDTCIDSDGGAVIDCPKVDFTTSTYGIGDTNPILQGYIQEDGNTMKVLNWHQCPSSGDAIDTSEVVDELLNYRTCVKDGEVPAEGDRTDPYVNLRDQSWYNPLDVSKGHRGFLDGDFVMFLYAWSPNWRLNAKGNDRYDLYVRRSFDGGNTWTTTPAEGEASDGLPFGGDGTVTCETYRSTQTQVPQAAEPHVCYEYPAGGAEQARNVTQHQRMQVTTLDPRYAPTAASIGDGCLDGLGLDPTGLWSCDDQSELDSDERDPSRYFMVFETGDNSTVAEGEAEPDDLFYGRAESFGDDYVVWFETDTGFSLTDEGCYPSDDHDDDDTNDTVVQGSGFCNEFDRMNRAGDTHSSEANLEANPDGSKLYGVWTQWVYDETGEEIIESDAMARRIWWIDDYICEAEAGEEPCSWTLPGTNPSGTPDPQQ